MDTKVTENSARFRRHQGRPLGLQLLWLAHDCGGNAESHKSLAKRIWSVTPGLLYEQRVAQRQEAARTRPDMEPLFRAERPTFAEERDGEPFLLCGF